MAISKTLIFNNKSGSVSVYQRLIDKTSSGRLWAAYTVSNTPKVKYSDDNGSTWSAEETPFSSGDKWPSIFVNQNNNELHFVVSNSAYSNSPRWDKKNGGSWLGNETVKLDYGGGHEYGNILVTSGNQPFCFWADNGAKTINCKQRSGIGSWTSEITTSVTSGWTIWSVAACIDDNNLFHVAWLEVEIADNNHRKIMTATCDGSSFSSHTEHDESDDGSMYSPVIRHISGTTVWMAWARKGVGDETSYRQIRYKKYAGSWLTSANLTNFAGDHDSYDIIYCSENDTVNIIYSEIGSYASAPTKHNIVYKSYNLTEDVWSDQIQLTEESEDAKKPNATVIGDTIHFSFDFYDGANWDLYHGSYTPTVPTAAREIYDYVSTVSADVDVTLSLDPQVVIPEVGGKGDIVHLADDESEERIGFSSDFKFYITIRYDLLNESDAGTLLDIWADSSKANGRINSWKFAHPDGHTYVVRFDTDMTRLMSPTYYTIKNIRLKVLGRIAD